MNFIGTWFLKGITQILMSVSLLFSCEYGKEFTLPKDLSSPSKLMYDYERSGDVIVMQNDALILTSETAQQTTKEAGIVYDLEDLDRVPAYSPDCFKSNMDALQCSFEKINDYVKLYGEWPYDAERNMEEGAVSIEIILGRHGKIEKIIKMTTLNPYCTGCQASAIDVIENMPPWVPGLKNGNAVAVRLEIPVTFSMSI